MKQEKKIFVGLCVTVLVCGIISFAAGMTIEGSSVTDTPFSVSLPVSLATSAFSDVATNAWYANAANWCRENGVLSGTTNTTFSPDVAMTRAMLVTVLYRLAGSPEVTGEPAFTDTAPNAYYSKAVVWASASGMLSGYGNGRFGVNDPVTREQIATILWQYAGSPAAGSPSSFVDADHISAFAAPAVAWSQAEDIISGNDDNCFEPQAPTTRAEVAVILQRYLNGISGQDSPEPAPSQDAPHVYMTSDISPSGLMAVYKTLGTKATGEHVAVKLSTGEPGSNYLSPGLIKDLVQDVKGTIVECNTAYGGSRANTAMHYQVAADHGFTAIADVDIMDEDGSMTLPVTGGVRLTENYVGSHFANYDYFVVLSHFKGHAMAGFGGAIKNISIGIASSQGKSWIHSGGTRTSGLSGDQDAFLESMAEAGKSVVDALDGHILYINVMNRLSVDCDCDGNPAEPDMHDIGILASTDPVALDQACVDLVYAAEDGQSLINRIESRNGLHTLEHGVEIGLGSRDYQLVKIDE